MFSFFKNITKNNENTKKSCIVSEAIFVDEVLFGKSKESILKEKKEMEKIQQIQSQQQSPQEVSPDIV